MWCLLLLSLLVVLVLPRSIYRWGAGIQTVRADKQAVDHGVCQARMDLAGWLQ